MTRREFSSEGCADAMVAAGEAAEADNAIDMATIEQQRMEIDKLRDALRDAKWWLEPIVKTHGLALGATRAIDRALSDITRATQ